jgi:hypothetical protein
MATYLDLNGTTDIVGRVKSLLNQKASNDDVQVVVGELALKANASDTYTKTEIDDMIGTINNELTTIIG